MNTPKLEGLIPSKGRRLAVVIIEINQLFTHPEAKFAYEGAFGQTLPRMIYDRQGGPHGF